jgi:hypothetical protein
MWSRIGVIVSVGVLLSTVGSGSARASASPAVQYSTGWNMVGAPPGSDLSSAVALYVYNGTAYVTPPTPQTALCQGYWAYFTAPATVALSGAAPASTTQTCPLAAGWNLIGNPFLVDAALPTGTTGYHWNATTQQYDPVATIPVGGAAWIFATAAGSITLSTSSIVFTFGREGGNIVPYSITIASDGTVTATGPVTPTITQISAQQLSILEAQVFSSNFLTLPPQTICPGTLPDFASQFIEVQGPQFSPPDYRVAVRGGCVPAFTQLFAALSAAVGIAT